MRATVSRWLVRCAPPPWLAVSTTLAVVTLTWAGPADAQRRRPPKPEPHKFEVSSITGAHLFAGDVELGVPDVLDTAHPEHSLLFGARFLWRFRRDFALELELVAAPTSDSAAGERHYVFGWRSHIVVPLGYKWGPLESQLVVGAGALTITGDGVAARRTEIGGDTDFVLHWGVTGRWRLSNNVHLRGDIRHLLPPSTQTTFPVTNDFEFQLGVAYRFGGGPRRLAFEQ